MDVTSQRHSFPSALALAAVLLAGSRLGASCPHARVPPYPPKWMRVSSVNDSATGGSGWWRGERSLGNDR